MLPSLDRSTLLVIDIQERLFPAMQEEDRSTLLKEVAILVEAMTHFGGFVAYSEQYPRGLGKTIPPLAALLEGCPHIEKTHFSAYRAPEFEDVKSKLTKDVIVAGIEAHVCVLETGLDLLAAGHNVWVPLDAVASRKRAYKDNGLELLAGAGATIVNTESLVFHHLERAGGDDFKRFSKLIR